ncbi:octopamine receptor-like [Dendronephthya gigantea]|uniref:octopamine receptor-like n=1 Tax=Dendronephthya gigantea TaxID=151771 RepID=UPI00106A21E7|nr:octopamine receptor-like [Dendronephthya gigantea]XP_028409211.1 octopamine receptor-like [Dendronephthya gigantea]
MYEYPTMSPNNTTTFEISCNDSFHHFQFQPPSSFDIFTGVVMILIIVISLTGNIMILYAFLSTPKLRMVNNYFLMNLTLSDIITASLVIPFDVDIKINGISSWTHGIAMCKVWTNAYTVSVPTSILTLCVVSIDRYQAISNPLGYRAGVTLTPIKAVCLIIGVWGLSVFMALLPVITGPPLNETLSRDLPPNCPDVYFCYFDISPSYSAAVTIIAFILPSVVMAALYVRMYIIITYERHVSDDFNMERMGQNRSEVNKNGRNIIQNVRSSKVEEILEIKVEFHKDRSDKNMKKNGINEERLPETNNGETKDGINKGIDKNNENNKTVQNTREICDDGDGRNWIEKPTERIRISHKDKRENNEANVGQFGNADERIIKGCDKDRSDQNNEEENMLNHKTKGIKKEEKWHKKIKRKIGRHDGGNYSKGWLTDGNEGKCDKKRKNGKKDEDTIVMNNNNDENKRNGSRSNTTNSRMSGGMKRMRQNEFRIKQKYQTKVARHFSVIVLVQLLCWYPFSVVGLVYNLCDGCEHKLLSSSAQYFLLTIGYLSCAVNPYLYAYQQRSFRQVFKRMFGIKGK